jgi:PRTRC genetic system protein B
MEPRLELEKTGSESSASLLIRHLAAHATYEAALLFTQGQYLFYFHQGGVLQCKGVSAQTLRAAFVEEPVDSGWLPAGVMRWGSGPAGTFLVKFVLPALHTLHLSTQDPSHPRVITIPLPGLVFAGVHTTYYVWALREETFVSSAPLFRAPLPNVSSDGHICFGSNHAPAVSWQTIDVAWRLFLDSPFNADMVGGKSVTFAQDVRRQLLTLAEMKATTYPVDDLRPHVESFSLSEPTTMQTVDDVVEHYLLMKGRPNTL